MDFTYGLWDQGRGDKSLPIESWVDVGREMGKYSICKSNLKLDRSTFYILRLWSRFEISTYNFSLDKLKNHTVDSFVKSLFVCHSLLSPIHPSHPSSSILLTASSIFLIRHFTFNAPPTSTYILIYSTYLLLYPHHTILYDQPLDFSDQSGILLNLYIIQLTISYTPLLHGEASVHSFIPGMYELTYILTPASSASSMSNSDSLPYPLSLHSLSP